MKIECPHCNTLNPPQAVTCRVCNLPLPRQNAPATFCKAEQDLRWQFLT